MSPPTSMAAQWAVRPANHARCGPPRWMNSWRSEARRPLPDQIRHPGFEDEILRGAAQTLARTSVIIMEVYNFDISPTALRFPRYAGGWRGSVSGVTTWRIRCCVRTTAASGR